MRAEPEDGVGGGGDRGRGRGGGGGRGYGGQVPKETVALRMAATTAPEMRGRSGMKKMHV